MATQTHNHVCRHCKTIIPGYGSHFGAHPVCSDTPTILCASCLSGLFPNVKARVSEAYRELRVKLIREAAEWTNLKVGKGSLGSTNQISWTRTFFKRMDKLTARI